MNSLPLGSWIAVRPSRISCRKIWPEGFFGSSSGSCSSSQVGTHARVPSDAAACSFNRSSAIALPKASIPRAGLPPATS